MSAPAQKAVPLTRAKAYRLRCVWVCIRVCVGVCRHRKVLTVPIGGVMWLWTLHPLILRKHVFGTSNFPRRWMLCNCWRNLHWTQWFVFRMNSGMLWFFFLLCNENDYFSGEPIIDVSILSDIHIITAVLMRQWQYTWEYNCTRTVIQVYLQIVHRCTSILYRYIDSDKMTGRRWARVVRHHVRDSRKSSGLQRWQPK